ncbi:MAG: chemotaxis protein CheA [Bacteroidota bacterium]
MDQFQQKFIEEANDLIVSLEQALLILEDDPNDMESVDSVFRTMHTLKGNSAMFGFEKIGEFTHHLENIYDLVRQGKKHLTKEIFDITLASVDLLRSLLDDFNLTDANLKTVYLKLMTSVVALVTEEQTLVQSSEITEAKNKINKSTFYLSFRPQEDILRNGTNPLYLVDEINGLGKTKVFAVTSQIPTIETINPAKCYVYWHVLISGIITENDLRDVFIFVEDECEVEIELLANTDLLENEAFVEEISAFIDANPVLSITLLKDIAVKHHTVDEETITETAIAASPLNQNAIKQTSNGNGKESMSSIRVPSEKIDELMNLVSELVTVQARLSLYAETQILPELTSISETVQKLSRQLRDNAFSISLVPIQSMLTRFQRLVRDLSTELGKSIQFEAEGAETELDKTIVESLYDPMLHILRNSIDHGIEDLEERRAKGKPDKGKILLKAFYSGTNVHIQIIDDGAGINAEKVRQKAISKGLISADLNLTKKEMLELVFQPGFSMAEKITDVSGRGVGMDVVKRKITEIRGEVELDSIQDEGTTLTIKLPLTLSIIDGLLVEIDKTSYVIPLSVIKKIYPIPHTDFANNYNSVITLDGEPIPFHYLRDSFSVSSEAYEIEEVIVVDYLDHPVGLVIDRVIGEYQAVLKPLGRLFKGQQIFSGATILGDGTVAIVMDTNRIIREFSE